MPAHQHNKNKAAHTRIGSRINIPPSRPSLLFTHPPTRERGVDGLPGLDDLAEGDGAGAQGQHRGAVGGGVEDTDGREGLPLVEGQAWCLVVGALGWEAGGESVGALVLVRHTHGATHRPESLKAGRQAGI